MLIYPVSQAILTRLKADSGASGLWNSSTGAWRTLLAGGAYFLSRDPTIAPVPTNTPYLVWELNGDGDDAFTADRIQFTVRFTVYDMAFRGDLYLPTIIDRLHGDAMLQAGRVPTYGFHNHTLVLPSNTYNAVGGDMIRRSWDSQPVDERMTSMSITFSGSTTAAAVSP